MTNDINVRECGKLLLKNAQKIFFLILHIDFKMLWSRHECRKRGRIKCIKGLLARQHFPLTHRNHFPNEHFVPTCWCKYNFLFYFIILPAYKIFFSLTCKAGWSVQHFICSWINLSLCCRSMPFFSTVSNHTTTHTHTISSERVQWALLICWVMMVFLYFNMYRPDITFPLLLRREREWTIRLQQQQR